MTPSLQAPPSFTAADGGFVAESLDECVITQADTWDELRHNVREAVQAYFFRRSVTLYTDLG